MWKWIRNLSWIALCVLGAVGCSKVSLPRFAGGERIQLPGPGESKAEILNAMQEVCREVDKASDHSSPDHRVDEYAQLKALIREMSPMLKRDAGVFQRAHRKALNDTNAHVHGFFVDAIKKTSGQEQKTLRRAWMIFRKGLVKHLEKRRRDDEQDLVVMVRDVLMMKEGEACPNYYLDYFYSQFVKNLDLFGEVVFGSSNNPAQPSTEALEVREEMLSFHERAEYAQVKGAPVVSSKSSSRGSASWITLREWVPTSNDVEEGLQALERRGAEGSREGLVLDLRFAGGADHRLLARARSSAALPWGRSPMVLLVNATTRGVAAVFAYEMAQRPNVEVRGPDELTYGYGRARKQVSASLVAGLMPVNLTIGFEPLQPFQDGNRDGYRLSVRPGNIVVSGGVRQFEETITARADELARAAEPREEHAPAAAEAPAPSAPALDPELTLVPQEPLQGAVDQYPATGRSDDGAGGAGGLHPRVYGP